MKHMCAVIRICLNRSFVENYLVWGHWIEGMMVTVIGFVGAAHSNLDHRGISRVVTHSRYQLPHMDICEGEDWFSR